MHRNPFPAPSPLEKRLLEELVQVAKECYHRGWSWGTAGNFSLRGHNGLIWQSPTGVCKGDLNADFFIPIDLETEDTLPHAIQSPSAEMPVHAGIYKFVKGAKCVVHTHPPAVVSLSSKSDKFVFSGEEMGKALGLKSHLDTLIIPILPNATPDQMKSFSKIVKDGLGGVAKIVVLAGHGVWAWGRTPTEALGYVEALDILCCKVQ